MQIDRKRNNQRQAGKERQTERQNLLVLSQR